MYLKPSRRKKARTRTTIIIIGVIAAAVVALLFFTGVFPQFSFGRNIRALDRALPDNVAANSHGILYTENDTMHLTDLDGNELWNLKLEIVDAQTATSEDLICNYAGKSLQVMNYTKEQMFTTPVDSTIMDAAAGKDHVATLVSVLSEENANTLSYIYIFDKTGSQTGRLEFSTRQVIDFGFHGDSDMFWALTLESSGVIPVSYITTFKSDGSMTNSIMINTQLVERVYVTDSAIFASGTNYVSSYTYFGEKQAEQLIYGWYPAADSLTKQSIKLAYAPRTTTSYIDSSHVYSADLTDVRISLPRNVSFVAVTQDRFYAYTADTVYIYTMNGELEKSLALDMTVTKAKQISDNCVILWDQQKSYIMRLS